MHVKNIGCALLCFTSQFITFTKKNYINIWLWERGLTSPYFRKKKTVRIKWFYWYFLCPYSRSGKSKNFIKNLPTTVNSIYCLTEINGGKKTFTSRQNHFPGFYFIHYPICFWNSYRVGTSSHDTTMCTDGFPRYRNPDNTWPDTSEIYILIYAWNYI